MTRFTGRHEEAVRHSTLAVDNNPEFSVLHAVLVASHAEFGQIDPARAAARRLLELAPQWTIGGFAQMDFVRPELMQLFVRSLRKAGLPDQRRGSRSRGRRRPHRLPQRIRPPGSRPLP